MGIMNRIEINQNREPYIENDEQCDFIIDDIDEQQPQIQNQQIQGASLNINHPRQLLAKDGHPYLKRKVYIDQKPKIIEKIVPIFKSENVLKIERSVQTENDNNSFEEVHSIQQLLRNQ